MSSRQLLLIVIVALVLGAIGWVLFNRGANSWESSSTVASGKIISFPLNDVAQITVKDSAKELNLVKKENEWVVKERADYPANFEQVSRLLQKVWDLKPVQQVQVGPTQFARLNLLEPGGGANSGTLLDLKSKDGKRIAALLIGKQYLRQSKQSSDERSLPAGRYLMAEDGSKQVALISDPLEDMNIAPERWLDRDFIKIEKPTAITLAGLTPATNWKLVRENDSAPWRFADSKPGEELDSTRAAGMASAVGRMSFTDVLEPTAKTDITGLDKPSVATIDTVDGFSYSLKVGKLSGNNYPMTVSVSANLAAERAPAADEKPEDKKKLDEEFQSKKKALEEKLAKEKKLENRPYLIAKVTIEQLLKNRSDLVKPPPTPSPAPAPANQLPPGIKPGNPILRRPPGALVTPPAFAAPSLAKPAASPKKVP